MPALSIIKNLNVFKNALSGLCFRLEIFVIDKFVLQGSEKAFSNRIIQTLSFTAHAAAKLIVTQLLLVTSGSIGAALV